MLKNCETGENVTLAPEEIAMLLNAEPARPEDENYLRQLTRQAPRRQVAAWQKKLPPFLSRLETAFMSLCPSLQKIKPAKFCRPVLTSDAFCARLTAENQEDIYAFWSGSDARKLAAFLSGGAWSASDAASNPRSEIEQNLLELTMKAAADSWGEERQCQIVDEDDLPESQNRLQAEIPLCFARGEITLRLWLPIAEDETESHLSGPAANRLQTAAAAEVRAVAAEFSLPACRLRQLERGAFLPLNLQPDTEIALYCGKNVVFKGLMGKKNRHIAVKITKVTAND